MKTELMELDERFTVLEYLGSGAYGTVCAVRNNITKETVAIKKCNKIFASRTLAKRALREIRILRYINHPNIITLKDVLQPYNYSTFSEVYLVFEPMDTDLSQIIRSSQVLYIEHIQYFIFQLLSALDYLHKSNVIHRDVKPRNILVNADCTLKLADFGLARFFQDGVDSTNSACTDYVTTRWYRAPEILAGWTTYGSAIDMWSVGCILAELFLRKPLFPGSDTMKQLEVISSYLGKPEESFIRRSQKSTRRQFLRSTEPCDPKSFADAIYHAPTQAKDLIYRLINYEPILRPSAHACLHHPFLTNSPYFCEKADCIPMNIPSNAFQYETEYQKLTIENIREEMVAEIKKFKTPDFSDSSDDELIIDQDMMNNNDIIAGPLITSVTTSSSSVSPGDLGNVYSSNYGSATASNIHNQDKKLLDDDEVTVNLNDSKSYYYTSNNNSSYYSNSSSSTFNYGKKNESLDHSFSNHSLETSSSTQTLIHNPCQSYKNYSNYNNSKIGSSISASLSTVSGYSSITSSTSSTSSSQRNTLLKEKELNSSNSTQSLNTIVQSYQFSEKNSNSTIAFQSQIESTTTKLFKTGGPLASYASAPGYVKKNTSNSVNSLKSQNSSYPQKNHKIGYSSKSSQDSINSSSTTHNMLNNPSSNSLPSSYSTTSIISESKKQKEKIQVSTVATSSSNSYNCETLSKKQKSITDSTTNLLGSVADIDSLNLSCKLNDSISSIASGSKNTQEGVSTFTPKEILNEFEPNFLSASTASPSKFISSSKLVSSSISSSPTITNNGSNPLSDNINSSINGNYVNTTNTSGSLGIINNNGGGILTSKKSCGLFPFLYPLFSFNFCLLNSNPGDLSSKKSTSMKLKTSTSASTLLSYSNSLDEKKSLLLPSSASSSFSAPSATSTLSAEAVTPVLSTTAKIFQQLHFNSSSYSSHKTHPTPTMIVATSSSSLRNNKNICTIS